MADAAPATLGFREFARMCGWKPSYVTELKNAGRLVLTEDGRRVRVPESLRLIEDTRDPAKAAVAARHAAARGAGATVIEAPERDAAVDVEGGEDERGVAPSDPLALRRARAAAEREEALLRKALRDEQRELGELLQREDVVATIADVITTLRTNLENLPTTLSASLAAETAEERCRLILATGIEQALEELSRKFRQIGGA